ncbi:MAG: virulence factor SrfB [Succinivibrio sp.]|nr:virulence factor SrfB [Succinivibrio sp.]
MLADTVNFDGVIGIVENTGIQFLDYEFKVDLDDREQIEVKRQGIGRFLQDSSSERHLLRMVPNSTADKFVNPYDESISYEPSDSYFKTIKLKESLALYNGVWFPLPMYADHKVGPYNWARCRIIRVNDPEEDVGHYHATLAFDTTVKKRLGDDYYAPTPENISGGTQFSLASELEWQNFLCQGSHGQHWVNEWTQAVFVKLVGFHVQRYRRDQQQFEDAVKDREYEAHYLNMLACVKSFVKPNTLKFIPLNGHAVTEVDLILDIGNSRSCGILYEENAKTIGDDDFTDTSQLRLRDFNSPEQVYQDAFESRIEFQPANFDFDHRSARSGRPDAFVWPSFARVGHEAAILAANRVGSEGRTGLTSPKRYLWQDEPSSDADEWCFNAYSYQIPYLDPETEKQQYLYEKNVTRAYAMPVSYFINASGEALFTGHKGQNMMSLFSGKSTMTFMLLEIFAQAMMQMNSFQSRSQGEKKESARHLKTIVITTPPSMPELERETMRSCAYEALGILWKCLGYDAQSSDLYHFNFCSKSEEMKLPVPEIMLDWDEAQAGQLVYLYNECRINRFVCGKLISELRRPGTAGRFAEQLSEPIPESNKTLALNAMRIASIDIGGGTTDLVITDYSYPVEMTDTSADIRAKEILREGFKIAGDDILLDLITSQITKPIKAYLAEPHNFKDGAFNVNAVKHFQALFTRTNNTRRKILIQQSVQQIFMKVGYRILALLENVDKLPRGTVDCEAHGTLRDFLQGTMAVSSKVLMPEQPRPFPTPSEEVLAYLNEAMVDGKVELNGHGMSEYMPDGDLLNFPIKVDLFSLNRQFAEGKSVNIALALKCLAGIVEVYQCDVLLLTGRPSKLPGIRTFIQSRLSLPLARQIAMHRYECSWYPLPHDGKYIGDPKSTVAVGALLAYKRTNNKKMINFHFRPNIPPLPSPIRFFGSLDGTQIMKDVDVRYRFRTQAEINEQKGSKIGDPENYYVMVADKTKDEFPVVLTKNLGYRQFDNENFPATMLYVIEPYDRVEELPDVVAATQLELPEGEKLNYLTDKLRAPDLREGLEQAEQERDAALEALDNHPELVALREQLTENLRQSVSEQVAAEFSQRSKEQEGLLAKLTGKARRLEEEKERLFSELVSRRQESEVEESVRLKREELAAEIKRTFNKAVAQAVNTNIVYVKEQSQKRLSQLKERTGLSRMQFKLTLELNKTYPVKYKYLKDELKGKLRDVSEFEMLSIESADNIDFTGLVKVRLCTADFDAYWIDTGMIAD